MCVFCRLIVGQSHCLLTAACSGDLVAFFLFCLSFFADDDHGGDDYDDADMRV